MENAADGLKIAFAIIVFVTALTLTFMMISQSKATADSVFYSIDETNFYDHVSSNNGNRSVSYAEVVSVLYRYYKESLCVTVDLTADGKGTRVFDLKDSYANVNQIEKELASYIANILSSYSNETFKEEFVEVPISGIYETGEDGTQIVKASGGSKIYVTYTLE